MVSSQRYLADNAAAAEEVGRFIELTAALGPQPTEQELTAAAPELASSYDAAVMFSGRLANARLDDQRLEEQRAAISSALEPLVATMGAMSEAAADGDRRAMALASRQLGDQRAELVAAVGSQP